MSADDVPFPVDSGGRGTLYSRVMRKTDLIVHLDSLAPDADRWRTKNLYYHESLERILRFHIPPGSKVIE
ncbi:MAG: hypothetical protein WBA34_05185, partial [Candidatus Deferrimicrobiaceae bacterium]